MRASRYDGVQLVRAGQVRAPPSITTGRSKASKSRRKSATLRFEARSTARRVIERSSHQAKRHAGAPCRETVRVVAIPDHEAALGSDRERGRSAQHAVRMRLETLRTAGLPGRDHDVEEVARAERLELAPRRVVADQRRAPARGAKFRDFS